MIDDVFKVSTATKAPFSSVNASVDFEPAKILVIDDHLFSRMTAVDLLALDGYEVLETDSSSDILTFVLESDPDLILLDVMMPQLGGFEICQRLKQDQRTHSIPVIFMTVSDDMGTRLKSREVGGDDFLTKPLERLELLAKVKLLVQQKRLNEGLDQTEQVLFLVAQAIEARYSDGASSCARIEELAQAFGEYLQLSDSEISDLIFAARLHDIGTVGIPDAVLLKKEELTVQERELIKQHVLIGAKICQPMRNRPGVLPIIRHHHERWDGSGYPDGLVREQIPWLAQIFQILDIYSALTSQRSYKQALSPSEALAIMTEETAKGWRNPQLMQQFTELIGTAAHG